MRATESLPVVKVEIGFELLQLLYIACVTLITLWNFGLYSNTVIYKLLYRSVINLIIQTLNKCEKKEEVNSAGIGPTFRHK